MTLPFKLYRQKPSHPEWRVLHAEANDLAVRFRSTMEPPRTARADLGRKARSVRTLAQNWRINRRLAREGREDLRPFMLLWTALRTCNFTCTYCDDHRGNKYPDLSNKGVLNTEQATELLRVMRTRASAMYFAGGEPTLRKDLPELTRAARDLAYYPIIVNTNGSILHRLFEQDRWKTWLADIDQIIVSVDSLDLMQLRSMWVTKQPQDVLRNLLMLRELADGFQFKLMVNVVIQPDTIDEASDVIDFVNDLGIWLNAVPVNTGPVVDGRLHTIPEYRALATKILQRKAAGYRVVGSMRLNRRLLFSEDLTCRNTLKPHVDFDGRLVWPCKATKNVEPEYINVLDFDHVDDLYDHASARISPTGFHGPALNQCGGNCNWAQNYSTDAYAHGLRRPISVLREVVEFGFRR
jgi:MoaA/NifB/PqqE/SkfB family radical SAM enzyme